MNKETEEDIKREMEYIIEKVQKSFEYIHKKILNADKFMDTKVFTNQHKKGGKK